jgi:hypothetical protein
VGLVSGRGPAVPLLSRGAPGGQLDARPVQPRTSVRVNARSGHYPGQVAEINGRGWSVQIWKLDRTDVAALVIVVAFAVLIGVLGATGKFDSEPPGLCGCKSVRLSSAGS